VADATLFGDWDKALALLDDWRRRLPRALHAALLQEGQFARTAIIEGIDSGAPGGQPFAPLSSNTLMVRRIGAASKAMAAGRARDARMTARAFAKVGAAGLRARVALPGKLKASAWKTMGAAIGAGVRQVGGSKILVQSGTLRNSITVVRRNRQVFIGVLRSAQGRDGRKVYNIARIHEFGAGPFAVKWTPKSRAWWFAQLRQAGISGGGSKGPSWATPSHLGGMRLVRIPPRPFLRPVFRKLYGNFPRANLRYCQRVLAILQGATAT
jgi:hypothetical protein